MNAPSAEKDLTPHTHGGTDAPECTPYGTQCQRVYDASVEPLQECERCRAMCSPGLACVSSQPGHANAERPCRAEVPMSDAEGDAWDDLWDTDAAKCCSCPSCNYYAPDYEAHKDEPCILRTLIERIIAARTSVTSPGVGA